MAKRVRKKVTLLLEEDKDRSISAKLATQEQRQKLLNQIAMLRTYVSILENRLETPKFGQLQLPRPLRNDEVATRHEILDVRTELRRDLYKFAGIHCVKCEGSFVFEISSTDNVPSSDLYAVEILIDNYGRGKLGKWILPMSVDVQEILSRYPIDDLNNVRNFLKSCKHHVDCHTCRAKQLEELRNFLAGIKNARVFHTIGIAQVELIILGMKDIENEAVHNVTLYLCFNSAEVRPYKLLPDTDDNKKPSADLLKRLNKHFKPFLKNDLYSAFQLVNESQTEFLWKSIATEENEDNLDAFNESLEDVGFLFTYLRDEKKQKRNNNEQDERSALQDNETQVSLCVEDEQCENADVKEDKERGDFLGDHKKIKPHKRSAKTIIKSLEAKKSPDNSKESEVVNIKKINVAIKKNKSQPKVTSAASRIQRHKQSEKYQTDTGSAQIENNNGLSYAENDRDNKKDAPRRADGKRGKKRHRELFAKLNDTNSEDTKSPQRVRKRRKTITPIDDKDKEDRTITNPNKQNRKTRMNMSNSTPLTNKLPDKQKFFHASRISEIL